MTSLPDLSSADPAVPTPTVLAAGAGGSRSRRRWAMIACVVALGCYAAIAIAGIFLHSQANADDLATTLRPPSVHHLLGTDADGRDVLDRICVGAGISIMVAAISVILGAAGGLVVALTCGLGRRWADRVLMAPMNALLAFPQLLLAMAVAIALGTGLSSAIIGIAVTMIPVFAVTLRAEALRSRSEAFVEAAVTIGLPRWRIALRHVVPYLSTTMTVQVASNFGWAVVTMAALSYIGVGVKPPTPEWGAMISDGLQYAVSGQWWVGVAPGAALLGLVIAVNIFTDQIQARRRPVS